MRIAFVHNLQRAACEAEAEYDTPETVAWITQLLRKVGHDVAAVDAAQSVGELVESLTTIAPDLVFNTAEGTRGRFREAFYPALFEQLGLPFTGSDAYVCMLTLDKHMTKQRVAARGVPTPRAVFVRAAGDVRGHDLRFPVIVKPNFEGSSKGVTLDSVVDTPSGLAHRVRELLAQYPEGIVVEEFIVGRDVVVPFLDGASPGTGGVLEPASYAYDPKIAGSRRYELYDLELKTLGFDGVRVRVPADLDPAVIDRVVALGGVVFRELEVRDLGRADFRVSPDGQVYFLEVNALPSLEHGASLYLCGARAGLERPELVLDAVVRSAMQRRRKGARRKPGRRRIAAA